MFLQLNGQNKTPYLSSLLIFFYSASWYRYDSQLQLSLRSNTFTDRWITVGTQRDWLCTIWKIPQTSHDTVSKKLNAMIPKIFLCIFIPYGLLQSYVPILYVGFSR